MEVLRNCVLRKFCGENLLGEVGTVRFNRLYYALRSTQYTLRNFNAVRHIQHCTYDLVISGATA